MHRLFAALPIPDELADRLEPLRVELYGARWRRREHYHVTLCFYGKVDGEVAHELADALDAVRSPAISLELSGVGWFGRKEPRAPRSGRRKPRPPAKYARDGCSRAL